MTDESSPLDTREETPFKDFRRAMLSIFPVMAKYLALVLLAIASVVGVVAGWFVFTDWVSATALHWLPALSELNGTLRFAASVVLYTIGMTILCCLVTCICRTGKRWSAWYRDPMVIVIIAVIAVLVFGQFVMALLLSYSWLWLFYLGGYVASICFLAIAIDERDPILAVLRDLPQCRHSCVVAFSVIYGAIGITTLKVALSILYN